MPAVVPLVSNMLQRVLSRAFSSTGPKGSGVGSQLGNVRQAVSAVPGRPAVSAPLTSYSKARDVMFGIARRESGARHEFALDTIKNADRARRNGDNTAAGKILATGLATFFPKTAVAGSDTPSKFDAIHAGWQANLGRGVTALIARVDDQLHKVQFDANADVVHGEPSRDALLEAIRGNGGITTAYRHAITEAARLNNEGRHDEALLALRTAPAHQDIMAYFAVPPGAPGSDEAQGALSREHEGIYAIQNLANDDDDNDGPSGILGELVSYVRENPDLLRTRGLVQSVGAELFRVGAYSDVLDTVLAPVPPRIVAGPTPEA